MIRKGVYGEASKIREEVEELEDALAQGNRVMALVELSDLVGAVEGFLGKHFSGQITLDDLRAMSAATRRAFANGKRV